MDQESIVEWAIVIDAPPARVWAALTHSDTVGQAFFGSRVESGWREGDPITFSGEWEGKTFRDEGQIIKVVPDQLLTYTHWSTPEDPHTVTFHLGPAEDGGTEVSVAQDNAGDETAREHAGQTWAAMLTNLKRLVEG
jgi:uncharacterized protein YndB with AHSA1/START domain